MPQKLKTVIKYAFLLGTGIAFLYFAFKGQNIRQIWQEIQKADYIWVLISAISVWLAHVLRALRWQLLYQSLHYKVDFSDTYHAVIIGYLANLGLPRFGEIARCSVIYRTKKVPMFSSIGTVITERLFDVLVLFSTALLMLFFQYNLVSGFLKHDIYPHIAAKISHIAPQWFIVGTIAVIVGLSVMTYLFRKGFSRKLLRVFVGLRQGFGAYTKLHKKARFLTYTAGIWIFYLLSMYCAFLSLPATSELNLNAAFTALVFSGFAMAAPVQGGIGVFHWMVAQSLTLYTISFKDALAYATIIHSSQFLLIVFLGVISSTIIIRKGTH